METWIDNHIERREREIALERERMRYELAMVEVNAIMPIIAYMITASALAIPVPMEE
jgi:hypothetical protein